MKCMKHSRYEAKRRPTAACMQCWAAWLSSSYRSESLSLVDMEDLVLMLLLDSVSLPLKKEKSDKDLRQIFNAWVQSDTELKQLCDNFVFQEFAYKAFNKGAKL